MAGIILSMCALSQVAFALPEETLDILCPAVKKTTAPRSVQATALRSMLKGLEKGIDAVDKKGKTALILAAETGNRLAVCYLVASGADVTLRDKDGKSAEDYTRSAALRELLGQSRDISGGPAISHEQLEREALGKGLSSPESRAERLYKLAVTPRSLGEIPFLLALGVDLNTPGPNGKSLAELRGLTPEYLAFFVRRGYNPAAATPPISLRGDMAAPLAKLLLALDVKPANGDEMSTLWAALFADDAAAVAKMMAKNSALITTRTEDSRPLLALAQSAAMVQTLIKAGADATAEGLLDDIFSRYAETPCNAAAVATLIKAGAAMPQEALLTLCKAGCTDAALLRDVAKSVENVNAADDNGNTALHLLLINGTEPDTLASAVSVLIKAGANPKVKNAKGDTPGALAKSMGRDDILKRMKKAVADK